MSKFQRNAKKTFVVGHSVRGSDCPSFPCEAYRLGYKCDSQVSSEGRFCRDCWPHFRCGEFLDFKGNRQLFCQEPKALGSNNCPLQRCSKHIKCLNDNCNGNRTVFETKMGKIVVLDLCVECDKSLCPVQTDIGRCTKEKTRKGFFGRCDEHNHLCRYKGYREICSKTSQSGYLYCVKHVELCRISGQHVPQRSERK